MSLRNAASRLAVVLATLLLAARANAQATRSMPPSRLVLTPTAQLPNRGAGNDVLPLGALSKVVMTSDGNVVLADNRAHTLTLVSPRGELVSRGALSQEGGRTIVYAASIAVGAGDTLLVYEEQSGLLHSYVMQGPHIRPARATRLLAGGIDMCVARGSVYVLLNRNGVLIHQFEGSGRRMRSFAPADGETATARSAALAGGAALVCDAETGTIVLRVNASPAVRAFNADGTMRWRHIVRDFRPIEVKAMRDGSIRMTRPRDGVDVTVSAFFVTGGDVAVQVARGNHPDALRHRPWVLETMLLRGNDGALLSRTSDLDKLLQVGDRRVAVFADGSPRTLHIYSVSIVP